MERLHRQCGNGIDDCNVQRSLRNPDHRLAWSPRFRDRSGHWLCCQSRGSLLAHELYAELCPTAAPVVQWTGGTNLPGQLWRRVLLERHLVPHSSPPVLQLKSELGQSATKIGCSVGRPTLPAGCYGGFNVRSQSLAAMVCRRPVGGSCTDPNAEYDVTCNAVVDCVYDCDGECNPVSC